jgi:hypothetical protein
MRKTSFWLTMLVVLVIGSFKGGLSPRIASARDLSPIARNVSPLRVTDVSPDADFGSRETSFDPGGRIISLVVDPTNPLVLYAASEMAGVWKTVDGAHHWKQASTGLRTGMSQNSFSLAVDKANPQRLLYVTQDDDGRPAVPFGGLWASDDGAATWQHVVLPGCSFPSISSVIFASGRPFVAASCGIATTTDPTLGNATWTLLTRPPFNSGGAILATSPGSQVLFACNGPQVFRSMALGAPGSWSAGVGLIGACNGLAVTPDDPMKVLAVHNTSVTTSIGVSLIDMEAASGNQVSSVGTQLPGDAACQGTFGSGARVVFAARRPRVPPGFGPGRSYDIFAGDGCRFLEFQLVSQTIGRWVPISGTHVDTWSMAIPSTYDPDDGPCAAYIASDGGVFALPFPTEAAPDGCDPASGWVRAMSGLHVMYSSTMAGVSQPQSRCPDPNQPCPALYLPTADNDVWVSTHGGIPGNSWKLLGANIGDAGVALVDPALPNRALVARHLNYRLLVSSNGNPPDAGAASQDPTPPQPSTHGSSPPVVANLSQIMTLPSEAPSELGDYLAVESPGGSSNDIIVRNIAGRATTWFDVTANASDQFGPGHVGAIATSDGHSQTVIYVLTSPNAEYPTLGIDEVFSTQRGPGQVWKGTTNREGVIPRWESVSKGIAKAYNLYADPYDSRYVYVTDLDAQAIKSSSNGGMTWQVEKGLTDIATNHGEFRFDCGAPANMSRRARMSVFSEACGLQSMVFDRNHPEIRVVALAPGGLAFSRDAGKHWLPLDVTNSSYLSTELYELPFSLFYDPQPNPTTGAPSIYVALHGKSMKRVDGPFPSLASSLVEICPTCLGLQSGRKSQVVAVVDTLDARLPLHQDHDGSFRGRLLFDSATVSTLVYHLEVDGHATPRLSHALTNAERGAGVLTLGIDTTVPGRCRAIWLLVAMIAAFLIWLAYRLRRRFSSFSRS